MLQEISGTHRNRRPAEQLFTWTATALLTLGSAAPIPGLSKKAQAQSDLPTTPITRINCLPNSVYLPLIVSTSSVTAAKTDGNGPNMEPSKVLTNTVPVISSTMTISINTGLKLGFLDPSGLTSEKKGGWIVTDAEMDEITGTDKLNVAFLDAIGELIAKKSTTGFSNEPTGVAEKKDSISDELFFSDDDENKVYEGHIDPSGQITFTRKISTPDKFSDTEGVATDSEGNLVVAGGSNNKILKMTPGPDGVFTGICTKGSDDVVYEIDTTALGLEDPEGVYVYTAADGKEYYYAISTKDDNNIYVIDIDQVNKRATLKEFIDMRQAKAKNPADVAVLLNGDVGVVYRGVDNNDPNRPNIDGQMNVFHPNRQQKEASFPPQREIALRNKKMNLRAKGKIYRRGDRRT